MKLPRSIARNLVVAAALCSAAGCSQPYPEKARFSIDPGQCKPVAPPCAAIVRVHRVHVASPFDGQSFVYRKQNGRCEIDYYNGFIASPDQLLTSGLIAWSGRAGIFATVVDSASCVTNQYVLETHVTDLCGDFSDSGAPKATIAVSFFLIDDRGAETRVLFHQSYQASEPIRGNDPGAIATSFSGAYRQILTQLTADLRKLDYPLSPATQAQPKEASTSRPAAP